MSPAVADNAAGTQLMQNIVNQTKCYNYSGSEPRAKEIDIFIAVPSNGLGKQMYPWTKKTYIYNVPEPRAKQTMIFIMSQSPWTKKTLILTTVQSNGPRQSLCSWRSMTVGQENRYMCFNVSKRWAKKAVIFISAWRRGPRAPSDALRLTTVDPEHYDAYNVAKPWAKNTCIFITFEDPGPRQLLYA